MVQVSFPFEKNKNKNVYIIERNLKQILNIKDNICATIRMKTRLNKMDPIIFAQQAW